MMPNRSKTMKKRKKISITFFPNEYELHPFPLNNQRVLSRQSKNQVKLKQNKKKTKK
jgi:hypothetical protein